MTRDSLQSSEIDRLTELADILIPGTEKLPGVRAVDDFDSLLNAAVTSSGTAAADITSALSGMPKELNWNTVQDFAKRHPSQFELLALVVSGAYVMAPPVLSKLGFPSDRRDPAGPMEAAEEYETGILDPVINRGQRFRDPRTKGKS